MVRSINNIVRFSARFLVFLFSGVAFLCALAIVLTQFDPVRRLGLSQGLDALNNMLQARVEVGSVSGNLITGLSLHDVTVIADSTTLLTTPLIDLRYQLRPFFREGIIGVTAVIHNPVINLVRNARDSVWNFARITKPSPVTDSVSTPFPYTINVHGLEIRNATVSLSDLTQPDDFDTVTRSVNYSYISLENFNLSARAHIESVTQSVWIQNMTFDMPRPDIRLVDLAGHIAIDTTGITVEDLQLETDRTLLELDARLDSVNFFANEAPGPEKWGRSPIHLQLDAERISTLELKRFVPSLDFLGGSPAIELKAEGTYGDITIANLELGLTHSDIAINGRIRNLDRPDSLFMDVRMRESELSYADVPLHVPGLDIPDLGYLGDVEIRSAAFVGAPQAFNTAIDAVTAIGTVRGGAWMDLRGTVARYTADLALAHANLAPVLNDPSYASDFNGHILASGRGFGLDELNSDVRLYSESSTIAGRTYRRLILDGSARDGGFIMADTLLVAWGPKGEPDEAAILGRAPATVVAFMRRNVTATLEQPVPAGSIEGELFVQQPSLTLGGWLDLREKDTPRYNVSARGNRFALSDILPDASPTRMTFTVEGSGVNFDPDRMQGTASVNVTAAELPGGRPFTPVNAEVALMIDSAADRTLRLRSNLADLDMTGRWDFTNVIEGVAQGIDGIVEYLSKKANYREEDLFALEERPFGDPVNARYELDIKNLAPLSLFLNGAEIAARGELRGEISGTSQLFSITAAGSLRNFLYEQDSLRLQLLSTQIDIELRNISPGRIEDISTARVLLRADSLAQFNDVILNAPRIIVALEEGAFRVSGATAVNNAVSLAIGGEVNTTDPEGYRIRLDTVRVGLPNGLRWRNLGVVQALVNEDVVRIDSLAMRRRRGETVAITGSLVGGSRLEHVVIRATDGSIRGLAPFIGSDQALAIDQMGGWLRELRFEVDGTLEDPAIDGTIAIDSMSYSGNFIGNIMSDVHYADRNLTGSIQISDLLFPTAPDRVNERLMVDTSRLTARIDINALPIDLALASRDERLISGRDADIQARTDSLPIAFLAPFLSGAQIRGGLADIRFSATGRFPDLDYVGEGAIHNARVLVEGNNILYYGDARVRFERDILAIDELIVRNDPRDLVGGRATVQGTIDLTGLELGEINLIARTDQLLVLSEATQAVNETIYGDLVIASGQQPLHFSGTMDHPFLSGDVAILNGNLRMEQGGVERVSSEVVNYVDYADWMRQFEEDTYGPPAPESAGGGELSQTDTVDEFDASTEPEPESLDEKFAAAQDRLSRIPARSTGERAAFTDVLQLALDITISERLFLTIDFSPIEQLRAELSNDGDTLRVRRGADGEMNITGTVSVLPGSKYIFIKTFDATGSLSFSGNIDNTKLGIRAQHNGRALRADNSSLREYEVIVNITGTLETPEIRLDYTLDGQPPTSPDQDTRNRNAISLLLFGRTADELAGTALRSNVSDLSNSIIGSGTSSVASRILTDILAGGTEFIRSLDIDMSGRPGDFSQAKLNVVSQFGKVVVRVGGQISNPTANGTVTVDLPLSVLLDIKALRNFVLQLEREAQSSESSATNLPLESDELIYRIRLQWRQIW